MTEIEPLELKQRIDAGQDWLIVDVREAMELEQVSLPHAVHIPMAEIPARLDELPRDRNVAVLCHSGARSARVTEYLDAQGFEFAANVAGGIDRWATTVDSTLARY